MIAPSLQTEGKQLQREQQVGMASTGQSVSAPRSEAIPANGGGAPVPVG
jgi:hypothetical protein